MSASVYVEEVFVAYRPDGSRAGEFTSELEALRFLYLDVCAELKALKASLADVVPQRPPDR